MSTATFDHVQPTAEPAELPHVPKPATQPMHATRRRKLTFLSTLVAVPAVAGVVTALRGPRAGVLAGSATALALGALRWQLARWFTDTPAYELEGRAGRLELRRYPLMIEARAEDIDANDFDSALDRGFGRLACYIFGANDNAEDLPMSTPVLTAMRDGRYQMSFVMPPGRSLAMLPRPQDSRVTLREVAERRVAVLPFRGRFTHANVAAHERMLLAELVNTGLVARGSILFAGYDSPATLPLLRRNEVWIEIV